MTVYAYSKVAVYAELAGTLRLARSTRVQVTDAVTGDPVNVTQGALTAPYLDTDTSGIATFTAEHPGPLRLTAGTTAVDAYSNELPGIALAAVVAAEDAADAAADSAAAAAVSAGLVGAPADAAVTTLITTPGTATRAAGDARWIQTRAGLSVDHVDNTSDADKPVSTATTAAIASLQAQSASIEDLTFTTLIQLGTATTWPNTATTSMPIFSAPFACQITRVAMVMSNSAGNVALNDTNYWLVEIRKWNVGNTVTTLLAQKSTKTNALASPGGPASSGVPAGTAITARVAWEFASAILAGATLAAGETLSWNTFVGGTTPTAWTGTISLTISYRPL